MSNIDIAIAERSVREAEQALEQARAALRRAANTYPREPEVGATIRFRLRYVTGPRTYEYAAIRSPRGWALTGAETGNRTWRQLIDWLRSDDKRTVSDIHVMADQSILKVNP